jgi:hypothetical protein
MTNQAGANTKKDSSIAISAVFPVDIVAKREDFTSTDAGF